MGAPTCDDFGHRAATHPRDSECATASQTKRTKVRPAITTVSSSTYSKLSSHSVELPVPEGTE